jgi:hypothetical protein
LAKDHLFFLETFGCGYVREEYPYPFVTANLVKIIQMPVPLAKRMPNNMICIGEPITLLIVSKCREGFWINIEYIS